MAVIQNEDRLVEALRILNRHENEIQQFYLSLLNLQVSNIGTEQKIKDAFAASVSERRGASFKRGKKAVEYFNGHYHEIFDNNFLQELNNQPENAHKIIFEKLVTIEQVEQKIASMFLKFLVVYLNEFPKLKEFLFLPVDGVVLKILKEKRLDVYTGKWKQSPSVSPLYKKRNTLPTKSYARFLDFQNELNNIAVQAGVNRIVADGLWFVGYVFCKEYPLCSKCWIRELCQKQM